MTVDDRQMELCGGVVSNEFVYLLFVFVHAFV
jgi:hypothetical protein